MRRVKIEACAWSKQGLGAPTVLLPPPAFPYAANHPLCYGTLSAFLIDMNWLPQSSP
jgi:hypothetical protein